MNTFAKRVIKIVDYVKVKKTHESNSKILFEQIIFSDAHAALKWEKYLRAMWNANFQWARHDDYLKK